MQFAVLTKKKNHFSAIEECFDIDGIACQCFEDTPSLLRASRSQNYDLTLIDAQLFSTHGEELLAWRECHADHSMQIIVFGQFADRNSMLQAFNASVSDVLVGDIDQNEMYVRTHRILKTLKKDAKNTISRITVGDYSLCQKQTLITYKEEPIYLTAREFAMAWLFFSNPGVFFNKQQLASMIWGCTTELAERTIEQHIYKLRKKLHITKNSVVSLQTAYSLGYQLEIQAVTEPEEIRTLVASYLRQLSENAIGVSSKNVAAPIENHLPSPTFSDASTSDVI